LYRYNKAPFLEILDVAENAFDDVAAAVGRCTLTPPDP
jgi:hypothetical protein